MTPTDAWLYASAAAVAALALFVVPYQSGEVWRAIAAEKGHTRRSRLGARLWLALVAVLAESVAASYIWLALTR